MQIYSQASREDSVTLWGLIPFYFPPSVHCREGWLTVEFRIRLWIQRVRWTIRRLRATRARDNRLSAPYEEEEDVSTIDYIFYMLNILVNKNEIKAPHYLYLFSSTKPQRIKHFMEHLRQSSQSLSVSALDRIIFKEQRGRSLRHSSHGTLAKARHVSR